MNSKISFDWYLLIILLGIFQALLLSVLILQKAWKEGLRFRYLSLFIFSLAIVLAEVFLDYSGYMLEVIRVDKFSFPVQFLIAPSLYLFIRTSLNSDGTKNAWVHFIPFGVILLYFTLYYFQDAGFKTNLHIQEHGLDMETTQVQGASFYDPFHIHPFIHVLVFAQLVTYAFLIWIAISRKYKEARLRVFNHAGSYINQYRNLFFYYILALVFMAFLVIRYFRMGDFIFSLYLTCILYLISFNISYRSLTNYFRSRQSLKYASSNLDPEGKASILEKIRKVAENEDFYCSGSASLEDLSNRIKESRHNVSQVINELLGKSFFEYLAELRIDKSKQLLTDPKYHNLTIDEISFMVGYNSRSAFNRVFKSITGTTPAEYRKEKA